MRPPALRAILRRPSRRVARRLSAAAAALSVLALALAAWAYEGIPQAEVDLNAVSYTHLTLPTTPYV